MRSPLLIFLCLFSVQLFATEKEKKEVKIPGEADTDLIYKTVNGQDLKLDIYYPYEGIYEKTPVVIYIHGGGWAEGKKEQLFRSFGSEVVDTLRKSGYAMISVQYRLVNDSIHFPAPVEDCKDAVRWVKKHAEEYNFDMENIGLFGASAGGHLAMLIGYSGEDEFVGDPKLCGYSANVDYVVNYFSPSDLVKLFRMDNGKFTMRIFKFLAKDLFAIGSERLFWLSGNEIDINQMDKLRKFCAEYSPVNYIGEYAPPTLTLHGKKDKIVPFNQAKTLVSSLGEQEVEHEYVTFRKLNHGFRTAKGKDVEKIVNSTFSFIGANLHRAQLKTAGVE